MKPEKNETRNNILPCLAALRPEEDAQVIERLSEFAVIVALFGAGLKLRCRSVLRVAQSEADHLVRVHPDLLAGAHIGEPGEPGTA